MVEKGTEIKEKQIGELFLDYNIIKNQFNYENNITYLIPSYQRVYKWEEELSEILFEDLILPKTEGYNFGFITVSTIFTNDPKETKYELIDGQQRLSTIFLIILSFRYKLVQLSAGKSEIDEIDKFIKNHFPFESNNSSTVNDMESVYNEIKNNTFSAPASINSQISKNFDKIIEIVDKKISSMDNETAIKEILNYFRTLLGQKIIVLKYSSSNLALESFIALNMKGKPLDSYEIFSALCLKTIKDHDGMNRYKDKLNIICTVFENNKQLLGFKDFEHFLKTMIVCMNYGKMCEDNSQINLINLSMPNHYVEKFCKTPSSSKKFINDIEKYLKIITKFMSTGKIDIDLSCVNNKNEKNQIEKRMQEIELLATRWRKSEKIGPMLMPIRKYIYALLIKIYSIDETNFENIFNPLTEICISLFHNHLIAVVGSDYKKLREENIVISSAYELREFYANNDSSEQIFKKEMEKPFISLSSDKYWRLNVIFQLKCYQDESNFSVNSEIVRQPFDVKEQNLEHFFIDKSRYKASNGKGTLLYNNVYIKQLFNESFAQNNLKTAKSKLDWLKLNYFESCNKEMKFLIWFFSSIQENLFENIDTLQEDEQNIVQSLLENKEEYLTNENIDYYKEYMNYCISELLQSLVHELLSIKGKVCGEYENKSKCFSN